MRKLYYVLITAAVSFLCYALGFFIPVLGFFILPFSSAILAALFIKQGIVSGIAGIFASALLVYYILPSGQLFLIPFIIFVSLNALMLYYGIASGKNKIRINLDSFAAVAVVSVIFLVVLSANGFQFSGIFSPATAGFSKEITLAVASVFDRDIYSVSVIISAVMVVLSYAYLSALKQKLKLKINKLPFFSEWRLPEPAVFVFIFALVFFMLAKAAKYETVSVVSENILILASFAYFVNGLAVGVYLFKGIRILLMVMYLFSFFYPPSAIFLGLADVWLNFRKKRGKDNEDNIKA